MPTEVEQNALWVEGEMDGMSLRGETEEDRERNMIDTESKTV